MTSTVIHVLERGQQVLEHAHYFVGRGLYWSNLKLWDLRNDAEIVDDLMVSYWEMYFDLLKSEARCHELEKVLGEKDNGGQAASKAVAS